MGCSTSKEPIQSEKEDSTSPQSRNNNSDSFIGKLLSPARECDGYPPPMLPPILDDSEEEEEFFIQGKNGGLACSLVKCIKNLNESKRVTVASRSGILFELDSSKPLIILCHGFLSWRNQILISHLGAGLSRALECHTLRFDFTGSGHSEGTWRYANYDGEVHDLKTVIRFVQQVMKTKVICVLGHSKACVAVLRHAWEQEKSNNELDMVPFFVAMSGRYYPMTRPRMLAELTNQQRLSLSKDGKFVMNLVGTREFAVTEKDLKEREGLVSDPVTNIRQSSVLIIHGEKDRTVHVSHAHKFDKMIPNSRIGIVERAGHSYNATTRITTLVELIDDFITTSPWPQYFSK